MGFTIFYLIYYYCIMGMYTCEAYAELYVHLWSPRRGTAGPSSFLTEWLNGVSKLQK